MNCLNNLLVELRVEIRAKIRISMAEVSGSFIFLHTGVFLLALVSYSRLFEFIVLNRMFF